MFHISFLVRDKHLADALRTLENKAMNLEVKPVKIKEQDEDSPTSEQSKPSAKLRAAVYDFLSNQSTQEFTAQNLVDAIGYSKSSAYNIMNELMAAGGITCRKEGTTLRYRKVFPNSQLIHKSADKPADKSALENA